ncbi:hypothetical protein N7510_007905 [Penicillium lagena]|uniref:uncharacterized protein n=1 Tax=Penicillium lagena TaxID=94218 RepID=UPI0025420130|nr:uncharacterized protein N7510_007905 [Penicillium lagena]KAJ5611186.1 hypothetical protein N7510_007905 [Penicillium lagena]
MPTLIPHPGPASAEFLSSGFAGGQAEESQPGGLPTLASSGSVSFVAARGHLQALESANETSVRAWESWIVAVTSDPAASNNSTTGRLVAN